MVSLELPQRRVERWQWYLFGVPQHGVRLFFVNCLLQDSLV